MRVLSKDSSIEEEGSQSYSTTILLPPPCLHPCFIQHVKDLPRDPLESDMFSHSPQGLPQSRYRPRLSHHIVREWLESVFDLLVGYRLIDFDINQSGLNRETADFFQHPPTIP